MTSKAPSKRQSSISTPAIRPACSIHSTAIIADKASLTGTQQISLGENSVLHPYAKLRAEQCKISIGANCIIAEAAVLGVTAESSDGDAVTEIKLEDAVSVDSGAQIFAGASIGEGSEVGVHAVVGAGAVIGKYCKISPKQRIADGEHLDDFTIVLGDGTRRRDTAMSSHEMMRSARVKGQKQQIETLRILIPNASAKWTAT